MLHSGFCDHRPPPPPVLSDIKRFSTDYTASAKLTTSTPVLKLESQLSTMTGSITNRASEIVGLEADMECTICTLDGLVDALSSFFAKNTGVLGGGWSIVS